MVWLTFSFITASSSLVALSCPSDICKRVANWACIERVQDVDVDVEDNNWVDGPDLSIVQGLRMVPKFIDYAFLIDNSNSLKKKFVIINLVPDCELKHWASNVNLILVVFQHHNL